MTILKKGQKYRTKIPEDYHGKATLTIVKLVNPNSPDGWVYLTASPRIKYKRHYNEFRARVWWVEENCKRVYNKRWQNAKKIQTIYN